MKILAAVDFSEVARTVAQTAVDLAWSMGGEVTLLHMYHSWSDYFDPPGFREKTRPALIAKLEEVRDAIEPRGVTVKTALEEGRPALGIVDFARRWGYDLVVVGAHGEGKARRAVLGKTIERVVRLAPMPVLVLPATEEVTR